MRIFKGFAALFMFICLAGPFAAQPEALVAPNVFFRGILLPAGVRYTATFIKPVDSLAMRNISVEITLPPSAKFNQMLVPQQSEFDVVRVSRERAITMIWQTSRLRADRVVDAYSFILAEPLQDEAEFFIKWQDETGKQFHDSFYEIPPLTIATQDTAVVLADTDEFILAEDTGVQVANPAPETPLELTVSVLPLNFNPPAELGRIWWCSLIALEGVPEGQTVSVIAPLRRSVSPFTPLSLFHQNADGSWSPLETEAFVSADGQYVIYDHPGGVVAAGGPEEIQQEAISADSIRAVVDAGLNVGDLVPNINPESIDAVIVGDIPLVQATAVPPVEVTSTSVPLTPTSVPLTPTSVPLTPTSVPFTPTSVPLTATPAAAEPTAEAVTEETAAPEPTDEAVVEETASPEPTAEPVAEETVAPEPTAAPQQPAEEQTPDVQPTPTLDILPGIVVNPRSAPVSEVIVATGLSAIEVYTELSFAVVQCQSSGINCTLLLRRVGEGFR